MAQHRSTLPVRGRPDRPQEDLFVDEIDFAETQSQATNDESKGPSTNRSDVPDPGEEDVVMATQDSESLDASPLPILLAQALNGPTTPINIVSDLPQTMTWGLPEMMPWYQEEDQNSLVRGPDRETDLAGRVLALIDQPYISAATTGLAHLFNRAHIDMSGQKVLGIVGFFPSEVPDDVMRHAICSEKPHMCESFVAGGLDLSKVWNFNGSKGPVSVDVWSWAIDCGSTKVVMDHNQHGVLPAPDIDVSFDCFKGKSTVRSQHKGQAVSKINFAIEDLTWDSADLWTLNRFEANTTKGGRRFLHGTSSLDYIIRTQLLLARSTTTQPHIKDTGISSYLAADKGRRRCVLDYAVHLMDSGVSVNMIGPWNTGVSVNMSESIKADVNELPPSHYQIRSGADGSDRPMGTPLIEAVMNSWVTMVECLIANGANVDQKNRQGITALMLATVHGFDSIANILRRSGATEDVATLPIRVLAREKEQSSVPRPSRDLRSKQRLST